MSLIPIEEALKQMDFSMDKIGDPTMSWSKRIKIESAEKICALYQLGQYTIESCCKAIGVNHFTFNSWAQPNLTPAEIEAGEYRKGFIHEIHILYLKTKQQSETSYFELLKNKTREGLLLRAAGMEYEEVSNEVKMDKDGNTLPVSIKKTKKMLPPDPTCLIFISKNVDKDNFSDIQKTEHSGKIQTGTGLEGLTDAELLEKRKEIESKLNSEDGL